MFVVFGEALMDVFVGPGGGGGGGGGLQMEARVGGSPFNVALGLARLGQAAAFAGPLSSDFLGQQLRQTLAAEGLDLRHVQTVAAPTTLALVGVDAAGQPAYSFYGEGAADRQFSAAEMGVLDASVRALHLGSYTLVVEPAATALRQVVEQYRGKLLIAYDPNLRLNVQANRPRWQQAIEWMVPRCDLIKLSIEDLQQLYPQEAVSEIAARWLGQGVKLVIVTCGAAGAQGFNAAGWVEVAAQPVAVQDTVGAGDTYQAALLTWLAEQDRLTPGALAALSKEGLRAAMQFAAAAAAITCSRLGADLPRRAELGAGPMVASSAQALRP